jgi:hypothetical protein
VHLLLDEQIATATSLYMLPRAKWGVASAPPSVWRIHDSLEFGEKFV